MNTEYEILTENGFKSFFAIAVKKTNSYVHLIFDDGKELKCTDSHLLKVNDEFVEACKLKIGDRISPAGSIIVDITTHEQSVDVYDAVNVDDGNHYLTNGLTSHNCEFLTEELTLIDSAIVTAAERRVQDLIDSGMLIKFSTNQDKFKFFKKLTPGAIYIVGVDPSTGSGNDNGVIQVFEFPSMEQVLEYTNNTLSPQVMYTELKSILNFLAKASDEIYFTVENNGVGQGVLAAYEGDDNPPENCMLISEPGKIGVNSNVKTKLRACLQFKESFERGKVTINSMQLLTELKSFIRHQGSYAGQNGATDDRVMATIIVFYAIQQMAHNNADAYDMVYTVASDIEARHGWKIPEEQNDGNENLPQTRSDALQKIFDSLHGTTRYDILIS